MNRTAQEVEADVEASRSQLDRNVEALKMKMTPGQMFDEAARMMGGTGQQVASKFAEQAKANPMPLAVMGLGLAWLMMGNNRQASGYSGTSYSGETRSFQPGTEYGAEWQGPSGGGLKDKVAGIGDKASDAVSALKEKIAGGAHSVGDGGRAAGEHIAQGAGVARDKAVQLGQQAQRTFLQTLESEPLLIAGLGLIVGAAVGAALPHTSVEDRTMGETRDKIVDRGKDAAQAGLQQASAVAQSAYGAVKDELKTGEGDTRDATQRVEDAVRSGVQSVREELQGPSH